MDRSNSKFRVVPGRALELQHFHYQETIFFPERRLPEYAVVCCFSGRINVVENNAQIALLPGEILIGNPRLPRASEYVPVDGVCEGATVVVGAKQMQEFLEELRLVEPGAGALMLGKIAVPECVAQMKYALEVVGQGHSGAQRYLDGFLSQFLVEVLWKWPSAAIVPRSMTQGYLLSLRHFVQAVEYMNQCAKNEFAVDTLCGEIGISVAHFRRLLFASAQRSPLEFYNGVLIRRAQKLIGGDRSLKQVSYQLGFATQSQFGKIFREHTGCSPAEYRERGAVLESKSMAVGSIIPKRI